jgi:hypothetical protein
VLFGDGDGDFARTLHVQLPLAKNIYTLDSGDLDGDGRADAAGFSTSTPPVRSPW